MPPTIPPALSSQAAGRVVELPPVAGAPQAFPLRAGDFVTGHFSVPGSGELAAVSVQIGNYGGTADGDLEARVCQLQRCSQGRTLLEGSVDNAMLELSLERPLAIEPGAPVTYQITKHEGATVVALWLYPPGPAYGPARTNGGKPLPAVPRLAVRLL